MSLPRTAIDERIQNVLVLGLMVWLGLKLLVVFLSIANPDGASYLYSFVSPYYYSSFTSTVTVPASSTSGMSACLGPFGNDVGNTIAIASWLQFHHQRWGLTHADIFVAEDYFKDVFERLQNSTVLQDPNFKVSMIYHILPEFKKLEPKWHIQYLVNNKCLMDARTRRSSFLMFFDPSDYLISDHFKTIHDMFEKVKRPAIGFSKFDKNYNICSGYKPVFGMVNFRKLTPIGSDSLLPNDAQKLYTEPTSSSRKYIVMPQYFTEVESNYEITSNRWKVVSLSGRANEDEDVKVINYLRNVPIYTDSDSMACGFPVLTNPVECPYLTDAWKCTTHLKEAIMIYERDEVSKFLKHIPLSDAAVKAYQEAICYARRYPNLGSGFCTGSEATLDCRYEGLIKHYRDEGRKAKMIFGCRDRHTQHVPTMVSRYENMKLLDDKDKGDRSTYGSSRKMHMMFFETNDMDESEIVPVYQSIKAGMEYSIVGKGALFEGFGTKWSLVQDALVKIPSDTLVVISDSRDVLININSTHASMLEDDETIANYLYDHVQAAYKALTVGKPQAVVMSAESQCCVSALTHVAPGEYFDEITSERRKRACGSNNPACNWLGDTLALPWEDFQQDVARNRTGVEVADAYLNSGLVIGTAENLMRVINVARMDPTEDDQAVFTDLMFRRPDLIVLDYAQEIFGNARWTLGMDHGGCVFEKSLGSPGRLQHKETTTTPLLLHTPGRFFECLDWMSEQLDVIHKPHSKRL